MQKQIVITLLIITSFINTIHENIDRMTLLNVIKYLGNIIFVIERFNAVHL